MTDEIEITDEMIRVINGDYLVKGIGAREAVRRILVLAEEQRKLKPVAEDIQKVGRATRNAPKEAPVIIDFAAELKGTFPKLDTTETGVRPRVSAREAEPKLVRQPAPIRCNNCGSFTHATMLRCVACNEVLQKGK